MWEEWQEWWHGALEQRSFRWVGMRPRGENCAVWLLKEKYKEFDGGQEQ